MNKAQRPHFCGVRVAVGTGVVVRDCAGVVKRRRELISHRKTDVGRIRFATFTSPCSLVASPDQTASPTNGFVCCAGAHSAAFAPTQSQLNGVSLVSATEGFAVGGSGTVLHTDTAGATWTVVSTPASTSRITFTAAAFVNSDTGALARLY